MLAKHTLNLKKKTKYAGWILDPGPPQSQQFFFFFLLETESSLIVQNKLDRSYIKAQPSEARNNVTVQACRNYNSRMHSEQLIKMQTGEEELTWHCCWRRSWLD